MSDKQVGLEQAMHRILARVDSTILGEEQGFPHYGYPSTGAWERTESGNWTGGFWYSLLGLAHQVTGEDRYRDLVRAGALKLRSRTRSDTVFRGFLFWYGGAVGDILAGVPEARDVAIEGALGLASAYNPNAGLIPLGMEAEEASAVGQGAANIDSVVGGVALLAWASAQLNRPELAEIAVNHARRHVEFCVRDDNSVCQSASFDVRTGTVTNRYTHKGLSDDSTWGRAQAWAMLGFAQAGHWAAPEFLEVAVNVSDWWIQHLPDDHVARWDFAAPDRDPHDTSATAIAAAALLKLARLVPAKQAQYEATARQMVTALIGHYLTPIHEYDTREPGILTGGCFNGRLKIATENELIWGTYFLAESILVLDGSLDPTSI